MQKSISVIIPVYNGERFIKTAIHSAIEQPEVSEIIVVNDGSSDGTQDILEQLQKHYSIIKIHHHSGGANKGRAASRNLALRQVTADYVAFLDADDYFLENRFQNDLKLFSENLNCDGVYNAIGAHFYREGTSKEKNDLLLYTVTEKIRHDELFKYLLLGGKGHFSIDGLTIKREVLSTVGFFNEKLVVAEDTEFLWRMSLVCRLESGVIDAPLAMRGVHNANVFDNQLLYKENFIKALRSLIIWASHNLVNSTLIDLVLKQLWIIKQKEKKSLIADIQYWTLLFLPNPKLFFSKLSIKYFPVVRYRQQLFPILFK